MGHSFRSESENHLQLWQAAPNAVTCNGCHRAVQIALTQQKLKLELEQELEQLLLLLESKGNGRSTC